MTLATDSIARPTALRALPDELLGLKYPDPALSDSFERLGEVYASIPWYQRRENHCCIAVFACMIPMLRSKSGEYSKTAA